ncbi:MAG: alpha/beta hydrolase [Candidatus Acidiferrales bacterium]
MNNFRRAAAAAFIGLFLQLIAPSIAAAQATGRAECLAMRSAFLARDVKFCALLPPGYDADKTQRFPVLYDLHGIGDNEQSLVRSGAFNVIEDLWEKHTIGEFVIVTPDADSSFYVDSHDGRTRYEDFFMREFLPFIEKRYRILPGRMNRGISGISMGGYGALHFAFKYPDRFGAVSAHSASLMEKPPVSAVSDQAASMQLRFLGRVFGLPPDAAFWARNSPFTLARTRLRPGELQIYFDCGSEDDYGFDAGAKALDKLLTARKIPHEFHIYPGKHDWIYFASHLPASLAFHSRAFGLTTAH